MNDKGPGGITPLMLSAKGSGRRYDDNQSSSTDSSSESSKFNSLSLSPIGYSVLCTKMSQAEF